MDYGGETIERQIRVRTAIWLEVKVRDRGLGLQPRLCAGSVSDNTAAVRYLWRKINSFPPIDFYRSNLRATRLPLATQNLLTPKPRELICMFETLDCITLLDLPAMILVS